MVLGGLQYITYCTVVMVLMNKTLVSNVVFCLYKLMHNIISYTIGKVLHNKAGNSAIIICFLLSVRNVI